MMEEYTDAELEYITETSETLQRFALGAEEVLSGLDYDSAFRFVLGVSQTAQEHISNILNDVAHGKGSEEQIRLAVTHLAPACLILTQVLYASLDSRVLIDRSKFVDALSERATATAEMALNQLEGKTHAH
jgi:hypothetical protein